MKAETRADADDASRLISALADGEVDAADCGRVCAAWSDAEHPAQNRWHAYHLIGDVLRSDDLASPPGRDLAFLHRLRERLADEPVVIAPQFPPARAQAVPRAATRAPWFMPAALAAGVMALATVLLVMQRPSADAGTSGTLAAAPQPDTVLAEKTLPAPLVLESTVQDSRIVRDARLDRYLQAHRDYGTALPGSLPGSSSRSIATVSFER
jgi:sigma-E factor negative regulatory protein RseA